MKQTKIYVQSQELPTIKPNHVDAGLVFGKLDNVKWIEHVENNIVIAVFFYRNGKVNKYVNQN